MYILGDDGNSHIPGVWPEVISDWDCYGMMFKSSPALADLDEDDALDLIAFLTPGCGAEKVNDGSNILGWPVYPGDPEDSLLTGEYPGQSSPVLGDLDNDGHLELLYTRHLAPEVTIHEHTIFMFEHTGGEETWSRNLQPSTGGASVISTPAVGDIDGDGDLEVVVCTAEGFEWDKSSDLKDVLYGESAVYLLNGSTGSTIWKKSFSAWFQASPVIADIDGDGTGEIIVGTDHVSGPADRRKLFVLNGANGSIEFEIYLGVGVYHSAAVGDLNDDGSLDFVLPCNNLNIYAWSGEDYTDLSGFPVNVGEIPGSLVLVDVDSDSDLEVVFGTSEGNLWALNSDGSTCSGFPIAVGSYLTGCPAVGEIDGDGHLEIVLVDAGSPTAYCLDLGAGSFPAEMPWRQFQHDSWHSGCFYADNTIPEPPTNLRGEITYTETGCEVDLEWDLSVNDPYSSSPEEPTDVIAYKILRRFSSFLQFKPVNKVHAGTDSYTDIFSTSPMNPRVFYAVIALDGTNKSAYSNIIKFPTSPSGVISLGCSVIEEFGVERVSGRIPERTEMTITEASSHAERTSVHDRTPEAVPTTALDAVRSVGNPGCLTDGSTEVIYSPSHGADAVVIDLGEECTVTSVVPERMLDTYLDVSTMADESIRTDETILVVEPSLLIEVAGSDREFYPFAAESPNSTETVRYIRIRGASGLTEVGVYGTRESLNTASPVEITHSVAEEGWMFAIPVVEYSEEALVKIFDVSGRMIWSGHAESGSVLHWDGYTDDRMPVPNGVYLLQCSIGSEVSTGSFVVRRN